MEGISLEESRVLSLFPNLDHDSSNILFYLMKDEKREGETLLVKIMEKCFMLGTDGMYQVPLLLNFFEKKVRLLSELKFGSEGNRVFDLIRINFPKIEYKFSQKYFEEAVL